MGVKLGEVVGLLDAELNLGAFVDHPTLAGLAAAIDERRAAAAAGGAAAPLPGQPRWSGSPAHRASRRSTTRSRP